jgi:hypothetical protein
MMDTNQFRRWRRSANVGPVAATFGGIAFGAALGCVLAFQCFDRVSRDLSLMLTFMGGAWGYIFWLKSDRARDERFLSVVSWVAFLAIAALLLAFPNLWGQTRRADGALFHCLFGGIAPASMLVVGTGWGLVHLVCYLSSLRWSNSKVSVARSLEGVWDRDLDQDLGRGKCDA